MKLLKKYIDGELFKYLIAFYTFFTLINFSKKAYFKLNSLGGLEDISWYRLIVYNILFDWLAVIIFMIPISLITKRIFERKVSFKIIIITHLFLSFVLSYFVFSIASFLVHIIDGTPISKILENLSLTHFFIVVEVNFLIYFSMLGIILVYYYIKKVKNIEVQKANLQANLADAKLKSLKAQLNPHFVFNTLNSISSLIDIDKEKSQDMITDFGDLFRDILDLKNENLIPLRQELKMLDKYIDIISVRFEDHIRFEKSIEDKINTIKVPVMLLQPLVENSVKHGYSYNNTELSIKLQIRQDKGYLHIVLDNNGAPLIDMFEEIIEKGTGVKNTYERLKTLYKRDFSFSIENNSNGIGVRTYIKIPI